MRRIELDYRAPRARYGRMLLGVGAIVAVATGVSYARLHDEAEQWGVVAQKASLQNKSDARGDSVALQQELEQANDVARRLTLPWDRLFKAMENSAVDKVALLSVQPDPQQQIVSLNGEAQAYADVLTYMVKLDASGALTKVRLVNHEIKRDDPQHPVAFTVTARWRITP